MLPPLNNLNNNNNSGLIPFALNTPSHKIIIPTNNNNNNNTSSSNTPNAEIYDMDDEKSPNNLPINNDPFSMPPQFNGNFPSFPIMTPRTEENVEPIDNDMANLMTLNLFGTGSITKPPSINHTESMPSTIQIDPV